MFLLQVLPFRSSHDVSDEQVEHLSHEIPRIGLYREGRPLDVIGELRLREILPIQMNQGLIHLLRLLIKGLIRREIVITQGLQLCVSLRIETIPVLLLHTLVKGPIQLKVMFALSHLAP